MTAGHRHRRAENEGVFMKRILVFGALSILALAALAADPAPSSEPQASKLPSSVVRSDSLEMPGVTACHQCEWRPKPNNMAAGAQCGVGPDGAAKLAEFECGFSEDCQRVCNFVRCLNP
jgi:hypothetical protein